MSGTAAFAIMAKAPVPGRCKTRLTSRVTPVEAAALGAAFLHDVTANLAEAGRLARISAYVAYAPAGAEPLFDGLTVPGTDFLLADGSIGQAEAPGVAGFGLCLLHAITELFARGHEAACVLNADSPNLPTSRLLSAASLLLDGDADAVLGPAVDGGYYLLGMRKAYSHLFADIDWSTDRVAAQTRRRAESLGLRLAELSPWYDVDDPDSLDRLTAELAHPAEPGAYAALRTRACLAQLTRDTRSEKRGAA